MADLLTDEEIEDRLPPEWHREDDEIVRVYEFDDYLDGIDFVSDVGEIAQTEFHHPTIEVRYKEVEVRLTTHDAGGITGKDTALAEAFDEAF